MVGRRPRRPGQYRFHFRDEAGARLRRPVLRPPAHSGTAPIRCRISAGHERRLDRRRPRGRRLHRRRRPGRGRPADRRHRGDRVRTRQLAGGWPGVRSATTDACSVSTPSGRWRPESIVSGSTATRRGSPSGGTTRPTTGRRTRSSLDSGGTSVCERHAHRGRGRSAATSSPTAPATPVEGVAGVRRVLGRLGLRGLAGPRTAGDDRRRTATT